MFCSGVMTGNCFKYGVGLLLRSNRWANNLQRLPTKTPPAGHYLVGIDDVSETGAVFISRLEVQWQRRWLGGVTGPIPKRAVGGSRGGHINHLLYYFIPLVKQPQKKRKKKKVAQPTTRARVSEPLPTRHDSPSSISNIGSSADHA